MPGDIPDALADWLERLEQDGTPEVRRAFEAWLDEDPAHRHEYDQIERQIAMLRAARRQSQYTGDSAALSRRRGKLVAISIGAVAALAAAAACFVAPVGSTVTGEQPALIAELTRPARFEDGTIAILAMSAQAVAEMGGTFRQVVLRGGSARFIVAREARPMIIKAPGLEVRTRGGVVDIEVAEGRSRAVSREAGATMRRADAEPVWVPVEIIQPSSSSNPRIAELAGPPVRVNWIEADQLRVADLLAIVNSQSERRVAAADESVAARKLSGRFDIRDSAALARRLAAALDLTVVADGDTLTISRR